MAPNPSCRILLAQGCRSMMIYASTTLLGKYLNCACDILFGVSHCLHVVTEVVSGVPSDIQTLVSGWTWNQAKTILDWLVIYFCSSQTDRSTDCSYQSLFVLLFGYGMIGMYGVHPMTRTFSGFIEQERITKRR